MYKSTTISLYRFSITAEIGVKCFTRMASYGMWRLLWTRKCIRCMSTLLLFLPFVMTLCSHFAAAQNSDLFLLLPQDRIDQLTSSQNENLTVLRQSPANEIILLATVRPDALKSDLLRIALPESGYVSVERRNLALADEKHYTWIGLITGTEDEVVMVVNDGEIIGHFEYNQNIYSIKPLGGMLHALIKINAAKFGPDHPTSLDSTRRQMLRSPSAQRRAGSVGPTRVDVMVAYTRGAARFTPAIIGAAEMGVILAGQAYFLSKIDIELNLVSIFGLGQYDYDEINLGDTLRDLIDGRGIMANVHAERNATGADLVILLTKTDLEGCGLAPAIGVDATQSFAVVKVDCIDNHSMGHEIGHLFGAAHDPYRQKQSNDPASPFAYGYGYVEPGLKWRTIMAYPDACGGCRRIQHFSNPDILYSGSPTGTRQVSDVARVHRERASTVAGFRSPPAVLSPPIALEAMDIRENSFFACWSHVNGARSYRFDVSRKQNFDQDGYFMYNRTSVPSSGEYNRYDIWSSGFPTQLPRTLFYRVRAVNAAGVSGPNSNVIRVDLPP